MNIAVIGAAGNVGSRIVAEALRRGHHVTPLSRDDLDAADTTAVTERVRGHHVGIGATRPSAGLEHEAATVTQALLDAHAAAGVRFLMVGGAGSLHTSDGGYVADSPHWVPASIRDLARTAIEQLDTCRHHPTADWTYITPSALMEPGLRTEDYRLGTDQLLVDDEGRSYLWMEDMAAALLDEIEHPAHRRLRFTVASTRHFVEPSQ